MRQPSEEGGSSTRQRRVRVGLVGRGRALPSPVGARDRSSRQSALSGRLVRS